MSYFYRDEATGDYHYQLDFAELVHRLVQTHFDLSIGKLGLSLAKSIVLTCSIIIILYKKKETNINHLNEVSLFNSRKLVVFIVVILLQG